MKSHHPQLSPLNFQRFVSTAQLGFTEHGEEKPEKREVESVLMYRCCECDELYECRDEAEGCDCIETKAWPDPDNWACPICANDCASPRIAADCCLWKDFDAPARWRMADAVEAGRTWAEQLGVQVEHLPKF